MTGVASERVGSTTYSCNQCGASLAFEGVRTTTCPYCASPNFVERPPSTNQPNPTFCLPFIGDAKWARARFERWLGSRTMFADSALKRATVEDMRGVYLPAYLYSAVARTDYNNAVKTYNTKITTFPTVLTAKATGAKPKSYYQSTNPDANTAPTVDFSKTAPPAPPATKRP